MDGGLETGRRRLLPGVAGYSSAQAAQRPTWLGGMQAQLMSMQLPKTFRSSPRGLPSWREKDTPWSP